MSNASCWYSIERIRPRRKQLRQAKSANDDIRAVSDDAFFSMLFQNGFEAGRLLASRRHQVAYQNDFSVLAVRRGRVPVAFEVEKYLSAPLDVLIVRKLGTPGQELRPSRLLAWRSAPGTLIQNAGIIRFQSTNDGRTRVHEQKSYKPPSGAVGHTPATQLNGGTLSCGQS